MRLTLFIALLFTVSAQADIVARVLEANGNSFAFDSQGKSKQLKFGGRIQDLSEIMVDDSGSLSLLDSSGNVHHLAGGAYVKFFNRMLEVKNGQVWTVIKEKRPALINTVNAIVTARSGQVVVSVDNSDLKTQALSLTGSATLASSIEPQLSINIPAGHFSFIDNAYEGGLPRAATRVGLRSYQKMKTAFSKVKELDAKGIERSFGKHEKISRKIASALPVEVERKKHKKKGKVIYLKSASRRPASSEKKVSVSKYYQSVKKSSRPKAAAPKLSKAEVRLHGFDFSSRPKSVTKELPKKEVGRKAARVPASIAPANIVSDINSAFEKSLKSKVDTNRKHSTEVNQLIDELNSFKKDYSKHY